MELNIPHHAGQPPTAPPGVVEPAVPGRPRRRSQVWASRLCTLETGPGAETIYYVTSPAGCGVTLRNQAR